MFVMDRVEFYRYQNSAREIALASLLHDNWKKSTTGTQIAIRSQQGFQLSLTLLKENIFISAFLLEIFSHFLPGDTVVTGKITFQEPRIAVKT